MPSNVSPMWQQRAAPLPFVEQRKSEPYAPPRPWCTAYGLSLYLLVLAIGFGVQAVVTRLF